MRKEEVTSIYRWASPPGGIIFEDALLAGSMKRTQFEMIFKVGSHVSPGCVVCLVYRRQAFMNIKHCSSIQWIVIQFLHLDLWARGVRGSNSLRSFGLTKCVPGATYLQIKEATVKAVRAFLTRLAHGCHCSAGKQRHTPPVGLPQRKEA